MIMGYEVAHVLQQRARPKCHLAVARLSKIQNRAAAL